MKDIGCTEFAYGTGMKSDFGACMSIDVRRMGRFYTWDKELIWRNDFGLISENSQLYEGWLFFFHQAYHFYDCLSFDHP